MVILRLAGSSGLTSPAHAVDSPQYGDLRFTANLVQIIFPISDLTFLPASMWSNSTVCSCVYAMVSPTKASFAVVPVPQLVINL